LDRKMTLPIVALALLSAGCSSGAPRAAATSLITVTTPPAPTPTAKTSTAVPTAAPALPARSSSTAPPATVAAPAAQTAAPCGPHDDLTVTQTGSQGAGGSRLAEFTISHAGHGKCTLTGWAAAQPVDQHRNPIPITPPRTGNQARVLIGPNHHARFSTRVSLVSCTTDPLRAPTLDVTLPGATRPVQITVTDLTACPDGPFEVSALRS